MDCHRASDTTLSNVAVRSCGSSNDWPHNHSKTTYLGDIPQSHSASCQGNGGFCHTILSWLPAKQSLDPWGTVAHARVSKPGHHWFLWWLATCLVPSHYLERMRTLIVNVVSKMSNILPGIQFCWLFCSVCGKGTFLYHVCWYLFNFYNVILHKQISSITFKENESRHM